jgi:hypothetical protein
MSGGGYATLGGGHGEDDAELARMVAQEASCMGRARTWCGLGDEQTNLDEAQRRRRWLMITTALFSLAVVVVLVGFILVVWQLYVVAPRVF